ncbi:aminotransferase class I/II-fold pyridoxal phosphate-dependent enzyme [bacterium]|nr:aminotransferase class I/II-fold pyridoxal phosphate-dependent enzyme [bacterium]NBS52135.1 aminotransferase class I/II-fold pyridoxal phosphate-dependent enzyme [Spartobacteria bacterium]
MNDVISLGIGEPDFATPWHIREAAIYALERGRTGYTSNLGLPRLRRSISDYIQKHFGIRYEPLSEILVSVGVSEAIDLALRALLNRGDEVIYHEPCYVSYAPSIVMAGGVPRAVTTRADEGFILHAEDLEKAITPRTRVLMLNFPTNPTGAAMDPEELEKIAAVCVKHNLVVLTDEIYCELTYEGRPHHSIATIPGMRERTVLLHGLSKAFAMTGWRIGFACAPSELIEAMMKIHQYSILCAPIMGQDAAIEALDRGEQSVSGMRREYEMRRNFIVSSLRDMGLECPSPRGAFYVFPKITSTGLSSRDFSLRLLHEKKVAVVPGPAFGSGGEGHVRCSFATALDQIKIAMVRMAEFCRELKA